MFLQAEIILGPEELSDHFIWSFQLHAVVSLLPVGLWFLGFSRAYQFPHEFPPHGPTL